MLMIEPPPAFIIDGLQEGLQRFDRLLSGYGVPIDTLQVVPTFQDGIARWSLDLRQSDLDVRPDARIKLLIEEVEMYEPATYAEEPLEVGAMSNWNKTLLPSGPRFVTTLDVTALVADQTPVD